MGNGNIDEVFVPTPSTVDYEHLTFPAIMRFDWVRVVSLAFFDQVTIIVADSQHTPQYQRSDRINIGCDPKDFPTADYIQRHIKAYTDWNMTVWVDEEPKYVSGYPILVSSQS